MWWPKTRSEKIFGKNVNFFCSSCCTEELISNIPAMAVLDSRPARLSRIFNKTVLHNTNLGTQKHKSFESCWKEKTWRKTALEEKLFLFSCFCFAFSLLSFFCVFLISQSFAAALLNFTYFWSRFRLHIFEELRMKLKMIFSRCFVLPAPFFRPPFVVNMRMRGLS